MFEFVLRKCIWSILSSVYVWYTMRSLLFSFLLPGLIFCSSSLYKKELASQYTVHSSTSQAKTLIHCGAICKSRPYCKGFAYDDVCKLITDASLVGNSVNLIESELSFERIYIDTSIVKTDGK